MTVFDTGESHEAANGCLPIHIMRVIHYHRSTSSERPIRLFTGHASASASDPPLSSSRSICMRLWVTGLKLIERNASLVPFPI